MKLNKQALVSAAVAAVGFGVGGTAVGGWQGAIGVGAIAAVAFYLCAAPPKRDDMDEIVDLLEQDTHDSSSKSSKFGNYADPTVYFKTYRKPAPHNTDPMTEGQLAWCRDKYPAFGQLRTMFGRE